MKKSKAFGSIGTVAAMLLLIAILLTDSAYAYVPDSPQTEINPKPEDIRFINEMSPDYPFDSIENSFDQFRLTSFESVDVTRSGAAGTLQTIWNVKSSGEQDNWRAYFSVGFDNMHDLVKKEDLEIMVVFDAQNKKRSVFYEDDYVNFHLWQNLTDWYPVCSKQMWGDSSPELMHNGWKEDISTGWIKVDKDAVSIDLRFFSTNGEKDNNDTAVQNIRVYFKDKNGPVANTIEAAKGTYKDRVDFKLVFDEPVRLNGTLGSIEIVDGDGIKVGNAVFDGIDETDSRKLKYHMDIQLNTEKRGLNAKIPNTYNAPAFSAVTDMAGNPYSGARVGACAASEGSSNGLLSVNIDNKPPAITKVDIPNAPGALKVGSRVTVNVEFSERIYFNTAVPVPTLAMNTGGYAINPRVVAQDTGTAGAGNVLQFDYTVGAGDIGVDRLDIKTNKQPDESWTAELTGDIRDIAGNPMTDTHVSVLDTATGKATTCQAVVDKTPPCVSVALDNTDWAATHTATVTVTDEGAGIDTFRYRIWGSTKYRVLSINEVPQSSPQYKFCDFSTLPAGENIKIEFETSAGGEFGLQIDAWDKAGNYNILLSDRMKFDKIAPAVSFQIDENDPGKVTVSITDQSGFDLSDIEMAWADSGTSPDESAWTQIDGSGGTYTVGETYTSDALTMPAEAAKLNMKRLFVRTVDTLGNGAVAYSQLMIKDLSEPQYDMFMPGTGEYMPYFYCHAEGTVSGYVYTELEYKWIRPEIDPDTIVWVSDTDVPVGDSSELYVEQKTYLSRPSAQRYFNNGELFNGTWNLYLKATYHGEGGAVNTSYPGPFSYNFDNTITSVAIDGGDGKACREKSINVEISKTYEGEEVPEVPVTGIYYFWGRGEVNSPMLPEVYGEGYERAYTNERNFIVNAVNLPDTGLYCLNVVDSKNNYETVTEAVYIDYHSPRGYMDIAGATGEFTDIGFKVSALDLTVGNNGTLEYSISIDEGDWTPWTAMDGIVGYYGNGVLPTTEEQDFINNNSASLYSSHQFPGTLNLPSSIEGPHTVGMKLRDAAGNESDVCNYVIYYDYTKPSGTLKYSTTDPTNQEVVITLDAVRDNTSLSEEIMAYDDDSNTPGWVPWNTWSHKFTDNGEYNVRLKDLAGNETLIAAKVDWIDKAKPVMSARQYEDPFYGEVKYYGKYLVVDVVPYDVVNGENVPSKLYYCLRRYETNPVVFNPGDPDNVWKEAVETESSAEEVVIEEIDGVTHYLLKFYNYNQDDTDIVGEGPEVKRHALYLRAVDEAGNFTYDFDNTIGYINNYIDYRLLADGDNIDAHAVCTPSGVDDYFDPVKTAGPVKVDLVFETPVIIVPMEGDYALPVDLNEYKIYHTVYISENGDIPIRVVNRFGREVIVPNAIDVWGIDDSLKPTVTYSPEGWTNGSSVTVTVEAGVDQLIYDCSNPSDISRFISSEGAETFEAEGKEVTGYKKVTYSFEENGILSYTVYNSQTGISGSGQAVVDKIDRTPPAGQIAYDSSSLYDETGEVSNTGYVKANLYNLSDASGSVTAINEGAATHVFTENGSFDFVIQDQAGNTTTLTAVVNSINRTPSQVDTTPPAADVSFWIETVGGPDSYVTSDWVNTNVHAVIAPIDESPVTIINNGGSNEYVFMENGSFTFELEDSRGNRADIAVAVEKIDKNPPEGYIRYSQDSVTQDVKAALKVSDDNGVVNIMNTEGIDGTDADGSPFHVFSSSGSFIFYVQDIARNTAGFKAETHSIDTVSPACTVSGVPDAPVNNDVRVTITADETIGYADIPGGAVPGVSISYNGNKAYVLFAQNASVNVWISDLKGNPAEVPVTVDKIDKIPSSADLEVDESKKITEGIVTVKIINLSDNMSPVDKIKIVNNYGSVKRVFGSDGTYTFVIADEAGNQKELPVTIMGIDSTPPELSLSYSTKERTKGPVTVTLSYKDASAVTILNNNGSPTAEFRQNGAFTFLVQDASGNGTSITARVENIDSKAPAITFNNTDPCLVFSEGGEYRLDDYTASDDIDGDVTDKVSITYNGFDINKPGEYNISYSVSDSVGNTASVSRKVKVISKDILKIFVNGQEAVGKTIITNGPEIKLQVMNSKGDIAAYWKKGKLPLGGMKSGGSKITGGSFEADAFGWYTILVQDQERNSYLICIYVSSMSD